jgi:glycolate oxidase iron-sulfur subunit
MHAELKQPSITQHENDTASQVIASCVHCGFCLPTCPTYQISGDELDSPRGRIYLIKSALENNEYSSKSLKHLDQCLTCRSCETTCPSGVEYGKLLEVGRNFLEPKRSIVQTLYRFSVRFFQHL